MMGHMPRETRRLRFPNVLYAHPFEYAVGVGLILIGLRALFEGATTPSVDQLPAAPLALYRVAATLGGVAVVGGLLARRHAIGRAIERAGCYVLSGALAGYAVLVLVYQGRDAGFAVGVITGALSLACLLRALAIRKTERVILATLREVNRDPEALRRLVDGRPPEEPRA